MIGGDTSAAALDGRRDIMGFLAPLGSVYQAGTLSENPLAVATGLIALRPIATEGFHGKLAIQTQRLVDGLAEVTHEVGVSFAADSVGGMFSIYFREGVPTSFAEATKGDVERFNAFFHTMLGQGVYLAPPAFGAGSVFVIYDNAVLGATFKAVRKAFKGTWVSCIWGIGLGGAPPVPSPAGTKRGVDH